MSNLKRPIDTPDSQTPYGKLKTYDNNIKIFESLGMKITEQDDLGTFLQHPSSKNKKSIRVFFDNNNVERDGINYSNSKGVFYMFTDKLEPLEIEKKYNTIHLIERVLEQDPLEWADNKKEPPVKAAQIRPIEEILQEQIGKPPIAEILGHFLLESTVTFLFGDGGTGKTLLATEMASAIAKGTKLDPFGKPPRSREVLYINYELTERQISKRYLSGENYKHLGSKFMTITNESTNDLLKVENISQAINQVIETYPDLGLVVIDNLSFILENATDPSEATKMVKAVKKIVVENNIALLVITHVPKVSASRPMSINDMGGASALRQLADNVLGFRGSMTNKHAGLLIELKNRHEEKQFEGDNIPLFLRSKNEFLEITFDSNTAEKEHIVIEHSGNNSKNIIRDTKMKIAARLEATGISQKEVARLVDVTTRTLRRWDENKNLAKPQKADIAK